jgi:hypothetical protein
VQEIFLKKRVLKTLEQKKKRNGFSKTERHEKKKKKKVLYCHIAFKRRAPSRFPLAMRNARPRCHRPFFFFPSSYVGNDVWCFKCLRMRDSA